MNNLLKEKRLEKNMTLEQVGNLVGVGKSTVRKWENGLIENMGRDKIVALSEALNISPLDILGIDKDEPYSSIETIYNKLNNPARKEVYSFAEKKLEEQESINRKVIPLVGKTAANPSVLEYGDVDIEQQSFAHIPDGADCAIIIQGDSMEPLIKNGEIVFYKRQEVVENCEIAIVEINGDGVTCKKVFKDYDKKKIILRSVNDNYEDRILKDEEVRIIGKVIL